MYDEQGNITPEFEEWADGDGPELIPMVRVSDNQFFLETGIRLPGCTL